MRSLTAAVIALAALGGACKRAPKNVDATEAECSAYRDKMFGFLPPEDQAAVKNFGMGKATPREIELCRQRMNSDEVQCALKATTFDDALACRSATDDRPDEVKRTPEECKAYGEHMTKLAADADKGDGVGPPLSPAMAKIAIADCPRWLSKKRYDCVMAAPTAMAIMQCPL